MAEQRNIITTFTTNGNLDFTSGNSAPSDLIFPTLRRDYLNEFRLFAYRYGSIPNIITENKIDVKDAHKWFLSEYEDLIQDKIYSKNCYGQRKTAQLDDCLYFLEPDLLIYFDTQQSTVRILFSSTPETEIADLVDGIIAFKERLADQAQIHLLVQNGNWFDTQEFNLSQAQFSLEENYNTDFLEINDTICKRLNTPNDKGLVLLHGEPGTGKTSYIRYLASVIKKKMVFFPPNLAESITSPNLISFFIENPNTVLVIEDAENILLDRHYKDRSAVSALLNLSDGLLADCLSIQLICTFNTDVAKIDSALLRKGRLIASYKFEALEARKGQTLSDKLGFFTSVESAMKLTDIYNQEEMVYQQKEKTRIGF
jgi:hypothetical protein